MTYRDDHEAAIARIAALERDLGRLETENAKLRAENAELARKLVGPKAEPMPRPKRTGLSTMIVAALALLAILVTTLYILQSYKPPSTLEFGEITRSASSGTLVSTGSPYGAWTFEVGRCISGQHASFHGVDLVAKHDTDLVMRIVEDPIKGTVVMLNVLGRPTTRVVERSECTTWDFAIRPTHTTVDGIRLIDGHAALSCKFADGGTLDGRLEFRRCN